MRILLIVFLISNFSSTFCQSSIIVSRVPRIVPEGKKWVLASGSSTKIEVNSGTLENYTACNALFLSKPRMVLNISRGNYIESENYSIVFEDFGKVAFANIYTYEIVPLAFVDKDFSTFEFQQKRPDEVGVKSLVFMAGESVYVANCLDRIELLEFNMTSLDKASVDEKNKLKLEREIAERDKERRKSVLLEQEEQKKLKLRAKTYDLQQYDKNTYDSYVVIQRSNILPYFFGSSWNTKFPSFVELAKRRIKYERFNNTYSIYYESEPSLGYNLEGNPKLIEGTDHECSIFTYVSTSLPPFEIGGISVPVFAKYDNLKIDFTRGLTEVVIKNGRVNFKRFEPDVDIRSIIIEEIKTNPNGKYGVRYEIGEIIGKKFRNIHLSSGL